MSTCYAPGSMLTARILKMKTQFLYLNWSGKPRDKPSEIIQYVWVGHPPMSSLVLSTVGIHLGTSSLSSGTIPEGRWLLHIQPLTASQHYLVYSQTLIRGSCFQFSHCLLGYLGLVINDKSNWSIFKQLQDILTEKKKKE